uniref:F-box domain-containing protein n=1 Tax=Ditylenchus dipsaci TaxID=166011 RepID=A0A915D0G5_9BILA
MISVTAAAHSLRRSSGSSSSSMHNRPIGSHLKAYGSGRVAMSLMSIDEELKDKENKSLLYYCIITPVILFSVTVSSTGLLFLQKLFYHGRNAFCVEIDLQNVGSTDTDVLANISLSSLAFCSTAKTKRSDHENTGFYPPSRFEKVNDKVLKLIFKHLDLSSVLRVKATCKRFHKVTNECSDMLPKFAKDQIKLYFDEGEVIIYPLDEKAVPTKHDMPPLEELEACLRHLSTLSLFVRGLIPIESAPVIRRLDRLKLNAAQIFFCGVILIQVPRNTRWVRSVQPSILISDRLIQSNLPYITSLRIWHESGGSHPRSPNNKSNSAVDYAITDSTLMEIAGLYSTGISHLETVDLANCAHCSLAGVVALIEAWYRHAACPSSHLSLSLHQCGGGNAQKLQRNDVISTCNAMGIPLTARGLLRNGFNFTMYIT